MTMEDCVELVDITGQDRTKTPERSFEGLAATQSWTEVAKRGRNKTRSKSGKINAHDKCILEY
jgi:hypothetical protein